MSIRRTVVLGAAACALSVGAVAAAYEFAHAAQNAVVVRRFLIGYVDQRGRFIATAGRGATNVDRNSALLFVFTGPVRMGPNTPVTLPLTLSEQAELRAKIESDPDYDPTHDGYELGVIPRKRSAFPDARFVATGSINPFSVIVAAGSELAKGQFFKLARRGRNRAIPNQLLFNPRYAAATFGKPGEVDYNPEAFLANTQYSVYIDGGASPLNPADLVKNTAGIPLAQAFSTRFTTTNRYVQDFTRPLFRTASPSDASTSVAFDSDIDLEFSEPMDISSFVLPRFQGDDEWSFIVRYTQEPLVNFALAGKNVLGTVRIKPQTGGNVVQFRPLQGFGKGPFNIEVVVTRDVTDLSGNNTIRQFQFGFTTEQNPDAEEFGTVEESFSNDARLEKNLFTPTGDNFDASWNRVTAGKIAGSPLGPTGFLTTAVVEKTHYVFGPLAPTTTNTPTNTVNVWYHQPIQIQMFYPASTMGGRPRTIVGGHWVLGTAFPRTYPNTVIQLGHASDVVEASGLGNINVSPFNFGDSPVMVVPPTTYRTSAAIITNEFVRLPDFLASFNYNGQRGMLLDLAHNGDPASTPTTANPSPWERWRIDGAYPIQCAAYTIGGVPGTPNSKWLFSTRFRYLTPGAEAQSVMYDIGYNTARTLPQQIVPTTQPQGTSVDFVWQGAKEDGLNPSVPDLTTLTSWVSDIRQLATYRYVRFRVTLNNNTITRTSPSIDLLTIPYVYK